VGVDNTLRFLEFKGVGLEDMEQHLFVSEKYFSTKNIQDDALKILYLATTFRDHALVWYKKLQSITRIG